MNVSGPSFYSFPIAPPSAAPVERAQPSPSEAPVAEVRTHARPASLADVLTAEERAFFQQQEILGPITYGPRRTQAPVAADAPPGSRLAVRA